MVRARKTEVVTPSPAREDVYRLLNVEECYYSEQVVIALKVKCLSNCKVH